MSVRVRSVWNEVRNGMSERQRKFGRWLEEQITACEQRGRRLAEDDRADEANFEKIRANVYDVFKTILSVAGRVCGEDERAGKAFFSQRAEQIPASWKASYQKAKQNGDAAKMHIETIKLDTIREIREMCVQIWGEAE